VTRFLKAGDGKHVGGDLLWAEHSHERFSSSDYSPPGWMLTHVLAPFNCCVHTASRPFDRFEVPTIVGFMSAGRRRRPWVTFAFIGGILPFMRRRNCIWARPAHCAAEKASKLCFMWSNLLRVAARPGFEWNIHAVAGQSDENGTVWWN